MKKAIVLCSIALVACATKEPNGPCPNNLCANKVGQTAKYQYSAESIPNESGPAMIPERPQHVLTNKRVIPVIYIREDLRSPRPAPLIPPTAATHQAPPVDTQLQKDAEITIPASQAIHTTVHFPFDSATLSAADQQSLLASLDKAGKVGSVLIVGFTDSVGTDKYNDALSVKRADAVKKFLLSQHIEESTIVVQGRGEKSPVDTNNTSTGRAHNRRAEVDLRQ